MLAGIPGTLIQLFCGFPQFLQASAKIVPHLGHERSVPYPVQFISHPVIWHYIIFILKESLNNPQRENIRNKKGAEDGIALG
jgi:hypothetical protein